MARKPTAPTVTSAPALLIKPREEVRSQLLSRVERGKSIRDQTFNSQAQLDAAAAEYRSWDDFNVEFLRRAFSSEEYAQKYSGSSGIGVIAMGERSFGSKVQDFQERVTNKISRVSSLAERLDLIDEAPTVELVSYVAVPAVRPKPSAANKKIFVVHGQDEEAKAVVARFIERCGMVPVILHEQANSGATIIEKFEKESDVGFAVILLTPDDVGGASDGKTLTSSKLQARARQNVILELGYFTGSLGRARVAALKKGDIELPSDYSGVVWTPMGPDEAWKMHLARELKAAGYEFDVATALGI